MLKKLQIFVLLVIVLLSLLISLSYSQNKKSNDTQVTIPSNKLTKPPFANGQWVLYEINISQIIPLAKSSKNNTYLLKTSIVGSETIDGESYFWEELSLVNEGFTIKSLKKPARPASPTESFGREGRSGGPGIQKPKRIIFQRAGLPAVEIDKAEISRQLKLSPQAIIPEIIQQLPISNSRNANEADLSGVFTGTTKVTYTLPNNKEKIDCQELVYSNPEKGGQIIVWWCEHIPLTGFAKLSYISNNSIISVKLVSFGFRETVSGISGKILKFGEVYK